MVKDPRKIVPLSVLKAEREKALNEADAMAAKTDISAADEARLNELVSTAKERRFQIESAERAGADAWHADSIGKRVSNPADPGAELGDIHGTAPRSGWQDTEGNDVHCLTNKQTLRSVSQSRRRFGMNAGQLLKGLVTGSWGDNLQAGAALSEGVNTAGAYLVPEELSSEIIDLARANSVVLKAGAKTIPMASDFLTIVRVTADPTLSLTAENGALPESAPTFGALTFTAKKLAVLVKVSRELMMDAPNGAEVIASVLAKAMAAEIDRLALVGGGGVLGICNQPSVNTQTSVGSPDYDDFLDGIKGVESANGIARSVIMSPKTKQTLAKLKTATTLDYLDAPPDYVALQRLVTTSITDALAVVGDFEQMLLGVRQSVLIETSRDAGFANDQIWIRATWRGDFAAAQPTHFSVLSGIS